jgi:NAD(P)-dependent dehydrogenase (short-subunit alcohol dehydrogenase family)
MFGCQQAAERMAAGGRIINLSSSTRGLCLPGYGLYDASKGAVEQLTRFFARELGSRQITVNAISPGATETESYRILDIALDCGFSDLSNFNRAFRAEFGVSPRVYRGVTKNRLDQVRGT